MSQAAQLLMSLDKQQKGVNLFEFAINPNDFGQSVENMFYVSFLVKDGRAGIQVGADGEMRICQPHQASVGYELMI